MPVPVPVPPLPPAVPVPLFPDVPVPVVGPAPPDEELPPEPPVVGDVSGVDWGVPGTLPPCGVAGRGEVACAAPPPAEAGPRTTRTGTSGADARRVGVATCGAAAWRPPAADACRDALFCDVRVVTAASVTAWGPAGTTTSAGTSSNSSPPSSSIDGDGARATPAASMTPACVLTVMPKAAR